MNAGLVPLLPAIAGAGADVPALRLGLAQRHPVLRLTRAKLAQLDIERRWKREQLKPRLNLEYNFLGRGWNFAPAGADNGAADLLLENYKYGINFAMPLLLRKERAGVALADLKIADTNWQLLQKQRELEAKFEVYAQQFDNLQEQISGFETATEGYARLLEAEQEKFRIGESSVFLLNTRLQKLLEARLKLLKLRTELQKAQAALEWAAGRSE